MALGSSGTPQLPEASRSHGNQQTHMSCTCRSVLVLGQINSLRSFLEVPAPSRANRQSLQDRRGAAFPHFVSLAPEKLTQSGPPCSSLHVANAACRCFVTSVCLISTSCPRQRYTNLARGDTLFDVQLLDVGPYKGHEGKFARAHYAAPVFTNHVPEEW